ncbi:hypothetical protein SCYAM73S_02566 [Streptomyces cyaneofuscatus]
MASRSSCVRYGSGAPSRSSRITAGKRSAKSGTNSVRAAERAAHHSSSELPVAVAALRASATVRAEPCTSGNSVPTSRRTVPASSPVAPSSRTSVSRFAYSCGPSTGRACDTWSTQGWRT